MLWELLSRLFQPKSDPASTQTSYESSGSPVSLPAQSQGSLNNPSWTATAKDQIGTHDQKDWLTKTVEQLRRNEGEVLHAYQDHLGFWTIGVGRLIDKRKGGGDIGKMGQGSSGLFLKKAPPVTQRARTSRNSKEIPVSCGVSWRRITAVFQEVPLRFSYR